MSLNCAAFSVIYDSAFLGNKLLSAPFKRKKTKRPNEGSATTEEGGDESSAREASDESIFDTLRGTKCDLWSRVETVGVYYGYVLSILRQGSGFKSALTVFFVTLFLKVYLNPDGFICLLSPFVSTFCPEIQPREVFPFSVGYEKNQETFTMNLREERPNNKEVEEATICARYLRNGAGSPSDSVWWPEV